jgi:site-specific DNA recombinase
MTSEDRAVLANPQVTGRKRALIYVRLSSYKGETDTTTSPERQEEVSRQYAASQGWIVVGVISDLDVSGSDKGLRLDRPGLKEVRARWAEADVLLFAKIDRIARNVLDWSRIREEADAANVALVSVADGLDLTTPGGRFVATILQAFAEMEAAMISTRTKEAVAYLAREGRHRGGNAPFGWRIVTRDDGPGYRLALDPETSPIVREAVDRVLAGETAWAIQTDFNRRGLPAAVGRQRKSDEEGWVGDSLRRLLRRPILRGMQVHQGDVVRDADGLPIRPHDALITDDEWTRLRAALLNHRAQTVRAENPPNLLLRDLVRCAYCLEPIYSVTQAGKPPQWVCSARKRMSSGEKCPSVAISRPRLEEYVIAEALRRFGDHEGVEVRYATISNVETVEAEEALNSVMARLRTVDDEAEEADLMDKRRALRARLKALQGGPATLAPIVQRTGTTFSEEWAAAEGSDVERALLLSRVTSAVFVKKGQRGRNGGIDPARLDVAWKPVHILGQSVTPPASGIYFVSPDDLEDAA